MAKPKPKPAKKATKKPSKAAALLAGGPPSAGASTKTTQRPAIGVPGAMVLDETGRPLGYTPEGFTAHKPGHLKPDVATKGRFGTDVYVQPREVIPRYFDGDQFTPGSLPPETIARMQRDLARSGLLKADYHIGVWDAASANAYEYLLGAANAAGDDEETTLARFLQSPLEEEKPKREPLVIRQTHPDDLAAVADTVARRTIGRKLRPDEISRFVSAYHAAESGAQQNAYNAQPGGGTVTDAPDPSSMAAAQIESSNPAEVAGHNLYDTYGSFLKIIGAA